MTSKVDLSCWISQNSVNSFKTSRFRSKNIFKVLVELDRGKVAGFP